MAKSIDSDRFTTELFNLTEETFESHHGVILDKGTTLFETLQDLTAAEASTPVGVGGRPRTATAEVTCPIRS